MKTLLKLLFLIFFASCTSQTKDRIQDYAEKKKNEIEKIEKEKLVKEAKKVMYSLPSETESISGLLKNSIESNASNVKISKEGSLKIKVSDLVKQRRLIDSILFKVKGYISDEKYNKTTYKLAYDLELQIPSDHFDSFINELEKGDGELIDKQITVKDLTDEYIDVDTRLKNREEYLIKYRDLLSKAKSTEEVLQVQREIRELTEDIESAKKRLEGINLKVAYCTIDLNIYQEIDYNDYEEPRFIERIFDSTKNGWSGVISVFLFLIEIWPLWIVAVILFIVVKRIRKKRRNKN